MTGLGVCAGMTSGEGPQPSYLLSRPTDHSVAQPCRTAFTLNEAQSAIPQRDVT
jgi:hypothetical protein